MDAAAHPGMGRLQRRDGLYPVGGMVCSQGSSVVVYHHLVQMDVPRLRIDQLLAFEWKYLLPINLFNLVLMLIVVAFGLSL